NYIKKIFLVSDNDAFNRLYEFLGHEYLNNTLQRMGYDSSQIIHRLQISLSEEQNRNTNPIKFYDTSLKVIYEQPLVRSKLVYQPRKTLLGKAYYRDDELINGPFDFSMKNRMVLTDLHSILLIVLFPRSVPKNKRFNLTEEDYSFLQKYMSMIPRESKFPQYDTSYYDAYVKFLIYGAQRGPLNPDIRIFNKVGDAYGFLTDAAYIVDLKNNIEFLLSATIACNSDEIFNDDSYDYETVGYPFMKNLGQVIYQHELQRQRKHVPDLSSFKFDYTK
ncbi:MAG: serine hydrolase, partial [Chitinophagaceae bacterium]|nr:serine hydrolase [Chitinophagaceae bacterium]